MFSRSSTLLALPAAAALTMFAGAAPALAAEAKAYQAPLEILNKSGATGTAWLSLNGNQLTVKIESKGLVPNAPHAQHIHGMPDGKQDFRCPEGPEVSSEIDKDGDGILSTAEGLPDYGAINISLTTKGDTSEKSGLAVDRMPTADEDGDLSYERTFEVSDAVVANLANLHVVQHGIDVNGNGEYDFDAGKSELDEKLPQEATAPANCGAILGSTMGAVPTGGVETGGAGTQGIESPAVIAGGALALMGAVGAGFVSRRRRVEI